MKTFYVKNRSKINGILGTIIFHLFLVLLFFSIKLHKLNTTEQEAFMLDFVEEETFEPLEQIEKEISDLKDQLHTTDISNTEKTNIAASVDREFSKDVSTDEYLKELMNELDINTLNPEHSTALPEENTESLTNESTDQEVKEHNKLTRINYSLEGRKTLKIPQPLFMCEEGGLVIIDIEVDENGYVLSAALSSQSTSTDQCLIQEAITAANKSRFTKSSNGQKKQQGYISFEFVPQ